MHGRKSSGNKKLKLKNDSKVISNGSYKPYIKIGCFKTFVTAKSFIRIAGVQ